MSVIGLQWCSPVNCSAFSDPLMALMVVIIAHPLTYRGLEPMQFQLTSSLKNVFETWVCIHVGAFLTKRTIRLIYIPQHPLLFPLISRRPPSVQSPVHANSHDLDGKTGTGLSLLQNRESRESDDGSTGKYTSACQREGQNDGSTVEVITSLTIWMFLGDRHRLLYRIVRAKTPSPLMGPCPRCFEYLLNLPHLYYSTTLTSPIISSCQLFTPSLKSSPRSQQFQQSLSSWEGAGDILRWWSILESLYGHWWDLDNKRALVISCRLQDISKRSLG